MDESLKTPVNSKVAVRVMADKRMAHAFITPPQNGGRNPTQEEITEALREAGVFFGVKPEIVRRLMETHDYNKQELIAVAAMPVKGADAVLTYHFSAEHELKPRELEDGSVDFKDLGLVTNVKEGELLCSKKPAMEGEPGTNVLGDPILAPPGKDVKMPAGTGTKLSEDGLRLSAAINGQVLVVNKRVTVSDLFTVEENVGIATGNIDFDGSVRVKGNISLGFKVKATGSVTVNGMMDGGTVEAGGHVSVDNGFNGMQSGEIISGGDVRCKYLQSGKVSAKGSIFTGHIVGCTVRSGDTLNVQGVKSQIYNSVLSARDTISCVNVGTGNQARPVVLEVGSDPELTQRKVNNPKETAEAEKKLQGIEMLYNVFAEREKRGILPADKIKDYENIKNTREQLQMALAELALEREEIEESMASMGYGTVVVTGNIVEGTHVVIGAERYVVPGGYKFVRFRRDPQQGIVSAPAK